MRLFVSIDLPGKVREKLHGWLPDRPDLRYTKQEQLHLTLLFLGECDEQKVNSIVNELKTVQFIPFEIIIEGLGAFPDRKNPRVIWAGVNKHADLLNLQHQISSKLGAFADTDENRSFKPHITLARTTERFTLKNKNQLFEPGKSMPVKVESFALKKSILSPEGSIHKTLQKFNSD